MDRARTKKRATISIRYAVQQNVKRRIILIIIIIQTIFCCSHFSTITESC